GERFYRAVELLRRAQDLQSRKQDNSMIVATAREAAQIAEDARIIAVKRSEQERQAQLRQEAADRARSSAAAESARAQAQVEAARAEAESERAAADRARAEAEEARAIAARSAAAAEAQRFRTSAREADLRRLQSTESQRQTRTVLLSRLNTVQRTLDTPRGLVVTFPDSLFEPRGELRPEATERVARIAATLSAQSGMSIRVE